LSPLAFALRRAGVIACACLLVSGAVNGCAPGSSTTSSPSSSPTGPTPYAHSTALAENLARLDQASGYIVGTMTTGSDEMPLSGSVSIDGTSSQIHLVEGSDNRNVINEIVTGGRRYASSDGKLWIDRGEKPAGTDLRSVLAGADTSLDSGVTTVDGVAAHEIVTAPDKVDVAPALGIDTWTFDDESTTLRIWAGDDGSVEGFGASMSWKVWRGAAEEAVAAQLDVIFNGAASGTVAAPASPWQWIQDKPAGIAFGLPAGWKSTGVDKSTGIAGYSNAGSGMTMGYRGTSVGQESLTNATKDVVDAMTDTPSGTQSAVIGSEDALWMTLHRAKQKDYQVVAIVVHETLAYEIMVTGSPANTKAVDALAQQIFSTVEFTR
jgi:hypothetical protein